MADDSLRHGARYPQPFPAERHVNGALLDFHHVSRYRRDLETTIQEQGMQLHAVHIQGFLENEFAQGFALSGPDVLERVV